MATRQAARMRENAGELLIRKLSLRSPLTAAECDVLSALPFAEFRASPRDYLAREGERLERSVLILDGYAARSKLTAEGKRQIVSLHIAGDFVDLHSAIMKISDHDMVAIGPMRFATVAHEVVLQTVKTNPGIALALWRETLVDAAIAREWLLNVAQREAYRRISHIICEMSLRLEAIGLYDRRRFVLPLTQEQLGETTGLTAVHVNRTFQRLRGEGLITTHGSEICIEDWDALAGAGEFGPGYLNLPD